MTDSTSIYYYGNSGGSLAVSPPTPHLPLSMFLRLLAPAGSDLPTGDALKKTQRHVCGIYYNACLPGGQKWKQ